MNNLELQIFTASNADANQRLDRFLSERTDGFSREKIKRAITDGHCRVSGDSVTSPSYRVLPGQRVELALPTPVNTVQAEDGDISLLWHDAHLAVLDKPAGLTVHPCPSCPEGTLVHRLVGHFPALAQQEGLRPGIVHRLDKDTSGLLAVALTEECRLKLGEAFAAHKIHKEYLALVRGVPAASGEIREPVGRHLSIKVKMAVVPENRGGKPAHSAWRILYADPEGCFSLLSVRIFTGRTHQIRVHMAHLGHPLWGDALYGPKPAPSDPAISRQMLHAWQLRFTHPITGESLAFACPPPDDLRQAALTLGHRMQRVVVTGLPGCGKSSLTHRLEERGIPTWSADAVVKRLYTPRNEGWEYLQHRFGDRFLCEDAPHEVDRRGLLAAMKTEPELRRELEQTLHAMARVDMESFWRAHEDAGAALAVAEVPLYLEARWNAPVPLAPVLVGVACPLEERHRRLAVTRGWAAETAATLDAWQWPEDRKLRACDLVVDNSSSEAALDAATDQLLDTLRQQRAARRQALETTLCALWNAAL